MNISFTQCPRKSLRLRGFNYQSAGYYFVTFCVQDRLCLLGEIIQGKNILNDAGHMVHHEINTIQHRHFNLQLDAFIVMPNHVHAIVVIEQGGHRRSAPTDFSLPNIIKNIKTFTTKQYSHGVHTKKWPSFHKRLWQRGYYEHVIRNDESLFNIRQYIMDNPLKWETDRENPLTEEHFMLR